MTDDAVVQPLRRAIGQAISRVRRIHYTVNGIPEFGGGPLELTIGGQVILIDNASDGEALRVSIGEWRDPFAEPLSPENREYVAKSGKWTAYDVSAEPAFDTLIGDSLATVEPIANPDGKVTGVVLRTRGGGILQLDVRFDELYLSRLNAADSQ